MENLDFHGADIPLLEPPPRGNEAPRRILYVLFRRKGLILSAFSVLFLSILIPVLLTPRPFVATSTVMIKPSRTYLNLSPTSSQQLSIHPSPETINSEMRIIRSREVMERVIKELPFPDGNHGAAHAAGNDIDIRREGSRLRGKVKVNPIRLTNLIQIRLESPHPEWAVNVVNKVAEYYLDQHLKVHQTQGVEKFYDEQERALKVELSKSEAALAEFQKSEGVVDVQKELDATLARLARAETSLQETESSVRETEERVRILEAQVREQRENVRTGRTTSNNPVISRIQDRIVQLELERDGLLQRYTKKHRLVMDREREIADLKGRLDAELQNVMKGEAVSLTGIHDGLLQSFLAARAELRALEARKVSLSRAVAELSSEAAELRRKSYVSDRLQEEVNAKKAALALYRKKGEEARISEAMDEQRLGNVSVFEKAGLPLPRGGLDPFVIGVIAFIVCLGLAVGLAFAIEFFNTAVRNETDVEEDIGLPVLASIQNYKV